MFTYKLLLAIAIVGNEICVLAAVQDINKTKEIILWKGVLPNGPGPSIPERLSSKGAYTSISKPRLIVYKPEQQNGIAMLVISGGGYVKIKVSRESTPAAKWLQSMGVTAFELVYRLPKEGWSSVDVLFEDGHRAMWLIRSLAPQFWFNENKIGIMGFSDGGHLAGMVATKFDKQLYTPTDSIDLLSARTDFVALLYPVITMLPPFNSSLAEKKIIGRNPDIKQQEKYSVQLHVNGKTPPTFLAHALDDPIANVENSKLMYEALQKHNVPSELHLFKTGGHGWGLGAPCSPEQVWPKLFENWACTNDFF